MLMLIMLIFHLMQTYYDPVAERSEEDREAYRAYVRAAVRKHRASRRKGMKH